MGNGGPGRTGEANGPGRGRRLSHGGHNMAFFPCFSRLPKKSNKSSKSLLTARNAPLKWGPLWDSVGPRGRKWWRMALSGTFPRSLDDKLRLAIPKRLLEDFGEAGLTHFHFAPGTEKSLLLYSPKGFERLSRRVSRLSNRPQVRAYKRFFYANAEKVELDSQGRIRIPERLVEFAGITREVVILGVHDHAEVWDATAWSDFVAKNSTSFDELATMAFE